MPTDALTSEQIELLRSLPTPYDDFLTDGKLRADAETAARLTAHQELLGLELVDYVRDPYRWVRTLAGDILLATLDTRYQEGRRDALAEVDAAVDSLGVVSILNAPNRRDFKWAVQFHGPSMGSAVTGDTLTEAILAAAPPITPEDGQTAATIIKDDLTAIQPECDGSGGHGPRHSTADNPTLGWIACPGCPNCAPEPPTDEPCETCCGVGGQMIIGIDGIPYGPFHCRACHGTGTRPSDQNQTNKEN